MKMDLQTVLANFGGLPPSAFELPLQAGDADNTEANQQDSVHLQPLDNVLCSAGLRFDPSRSLVSFNS
jgi:hypothetical protein